MAMSVRVPSMDQIELFENDLYHIVIIRTGNCMQNICIKYGC